MVRYHPAEGAGAEQPPVDEEATSTDEDQIAETYRNQYWTRLISVQRTDQQVERHPLGEDILEVLSELEALEEPARPLKPRFDPAKFISRDPAPQTHEYQLSANVITHWARQGTKIRSWFREKADALGRGHDVVGDDSNDRTRRGMTLSVASRDPLGQSETALRNQTLLETVPGRQYRPRRRKHLTAAEKKKIVDTYMIQYLS